MYYYYYTMEYNENGLDDIESKLNENLSAIVTSNYWSEIVEDIISNIPDSNIIYTYIIYNYYLLLLLYLFNFNLLF